MHVVLVFQPQNNCSLKPGFHMISRIAGDARIAQSCDQRSLHRNGNCLVQFASDHCVASLITSPYFFRIMGWLSDYALPAILAFEIDRKFSFSAIAAILASKGSRLSMNFSDQGPSFKIHFFVTFSRFCENWILAQNF